MTAAELNAITDAAAAETARYEALTNQVQARAFDHMAPLPPMPNYRGRAWETQTTEHKERTA